MGMVMGTSTVAQMPSPYPYGSDGDPTPRGVGFRLSPDLPSRPHQNEGNDPSDQRLNVIGLVSIPGMMMATSHLD